MCSCVCAGGISSVSTAIASDFSISTEVVTLDLSLYALGFALRPLLLAPLSEYYGRNPVYIGSWGLLIISQIPIAVAPNIVTVIVCRFLWITVCPTGMRQWYPINSVMIHTLVSEFPTASLFSTYIYFHQVLFLQQPNRR